MKINVDEMPEDKNFDDYPDDTEFVFCESFPRYDRGALKNNQIVRIYPNDKRYETAMTREELNEIISKI